MGNKSKRKKAPTLTRSTQDKMLAKFLILDIAYQMEQPEFDGNVDALVEHFNKMFEWMYAVKDHLITVNQVAKLIEEKTGRHITW